MPAAHIISVRNVQDALPEGLRILSRAGLRQPSRNGEVVVYPGPVMTEFRRPRERVLFWEDRDANPFFHLIEGVWMLLGREDLATVERYVGRMAEYSDDRETLHGAYGHRWRHSFGLDQVNTIARRLREDPTDRRCVLQMWDPTMDLDRDGKDVPCNTNIYFSVRSSELEYGPELDMTVCCRSNDMIWGAYGANAVHFSMLHEWVATLIGGVNVGRYWQLSNNFHAYVDVFEKHRHLEDHADDTLRTIKSNPYQFYRSITAVPLLDCSPEHWLWSADRILNEDFGFRSDSHFLSRVLKPMVAAHKAYRENVGPRRVRHAREILQQGNPRADWIFAANEWLDRRERRYQRDCDDGPVYD